MTTEREEGAPGAWLDPSTGLISGYPGGTYTEGLYTEAAMREKIARELRAEGKKGRYPSCMDRAAEFVASRTSGTKGEG